jgi:hypothetical protein
MTSRMRTKRSPGCKSVFAVFQNNPPANAYELLGNGFSTTPIYNTVGDWTRSVGTNLVNDARFGRSHIALNNGTSWASGNLATSSASAMVTCRPRRVASPQL